MKEEERRWIQYITQHYSVDLGISPCVYLVPKQVKEAKPDAYTPQVVGLGPYHHIGPDVQQMENLKRTAVKDYLRIEQLQKFRDLVNEMPKRFATENPQGFIATIRSCYDKYLDFGIETLAWIVTIDCIFLLHFVNDYFEKRRSALERLVPDIFMLENQIPFILMDKVQKAVEVSFPHATHIDQFHMFSQFCIAQSPFILTRDKEVKFEAYDGHLLKYMYQWIMKSSKDERPDLPQSEEEAEIDRLSPVVLKSISPLHILQYNIERKARKTMSQAKEIVNQIADTVSQGIEQASSSGIQVPSEISKANKILGQFKKISKADDITNQTSASQLQKTGALGFVRTFGGIKTLRMDQEFNLFFLPVITLRANSEVILRNLMAFEAASAKPGSVLEFAEYMDLMCKLIETEDDVKLLREALIIKGDLPDKEIVSIFNGDYICTQSPSEESGVQKIQRKLNEHLEYGAEGIKKFFGHVQKIFQKLFPILVVILLFLQYYCDLRGCSSRSFGYAVTLQDYSSGDGTFLAMPRKMLTDNAKSYSSVIMKT